MAGSVECWPGVVGVVAGNPPPLVVGLSPGDTVTVTFTRPTNMPPPDTVVAFHPALGTGSGSTVASWVSGGSVLLVTLLSTAGVDPAAVEVATGRLSVTVRGVRGASGLSPTLPPVTTTVTGTWGAPSPPRLLWAAARDTGRNPGLDTGDSLLLRFDQAVTQLSLPSTAAVLALLAFSPRLPVPEGGGGVACAGSWVDASTLTVTFNWTIPASSRPGWVVWNVGALTVSIMPSGNLTSANGESAASNSSAIVGQGSWGDAPVATVVAKSSTALVMELAAPLTKFGYLVTL